jgi:3-oxoacyl-[acyl-carrier protein] reductase
VALVTGGSRGIGRAVVHQLAADGFDVSFCYRSDRAAAETTRDGAAAAGGKVSAQQVDVRDLAAVRRFVESTEDELGDLDVVVANAGVVRDNPLVLMDLADWTEVRETNLDGVFHTCRAAIFSMMKRKAGCIIALSSVVGLRGNPTQSNYAAAKGGVNALVGSLAREVGSYGIRVNAVAPGMIRSGSGRSGRSRSGGWAPRRRSPTWCRSWPRTGRATSPARCCASTAGW